DAVCLHGARIRLAGRCARARADSGRQCDRDHGRPPGPGRLRGSAVRREAALGQDVPSCLSRSARVAVSGMTRRAGMRGQPLLLFGAVLTGWLAFRIALWESPFAPRFEPPAPKARPATMAAMAVRPISRPESGTAHSRPGRGAAAFVFDLLPG